MKNLFIYVILGFLGLAFVSLTYLDTGDPWYLFFIPFFIMIFMAGLASEIEFIANIFLLIYLGMIISLGLILVCTYVFTPVYASRVNFYINLGLFIFLVILGVKGLLSQKKNP